LLKAVAFLIILHPFINVFLAVTLIAKRGGDFQTERPWGQREVQGETWKKVRRLYTGSKGSRSPARCPAGPMAEYGPQE
jgi:hypothetical protein